MGEIEDLLRTWSSLFKNRNYCFCAACHLGPICLQAKPLSLVDFLDWLGSI